MSGGVDSSIALVLLKKQGWEPIGISLKLPVWQSPKNLLRENTCCNKESLKIAKKICQKLGVEYYIFDVRNDFKKEVIDYFISELKSKRTPNPCIVCNRYLKFRKIFEFAKKLGASHIATGHYARVRKVKSQKSKVKSFELLRGRDKDKDQSYALCFLPQKWLSNIVFPLGGYTKTQAYQMAKDEGFDFLLKKPQSQDFCFVAGKSLPAFIKEKIGKKPGEIVDPKGKILGKHEGLYFYTIGQRKGINLSGGPWFVKEFNIPKNRLVVTKKVKDLFKKEVFLSPFHFINGKSPKKKVKVMAKIRYQQPLAKAILYPPKDGKLRLLFEKTQRAITPGQFAAFYLPAESAGEKEICLGGGRIV